jgi:YbbR domain-containing protein
VNARGMIRGLVSNLGAKIVAVLFAVFLWLHVTAQQEDKQTFRVPLTLTAIPDSLTIIHPVPEYIEVTIRGARSSLIRMRLLGKLKASVDLSTARGGRLDVPLSPSILTLPQEFDPRSATVDDPKTLSLRFERVVSKMVPVKIAYKGEIPEDIIAGQPVIIPREGAGTGSGERGRRDTLHHDGGDRYPG